MQRWRNLPNKGVNICCGHELCQAKLQRLVLGTQSVLRGCNGLVRTQILATPKNATVNKRARQMPKGFNVCDAGGACKTKVCRFAVDAKLPSKVVKMMCGRKTARQRSKCLLRHRKWHNNAVKVCRGRETCKTRQSSPWTQLC